MIETAFRPRQETVVRGTRYQQTVAEQASGRTLQSNITIESAENFPNEYDNALNNALIAHLGVHAIGRFFPELHATQTIRFAPVELPLSQSQETEAAPAEQAEPKASEIEKLSLKARFKKLGKMAVSRFKSGRHSLKTRQAEGNAITVAELQDAVAQSPAGRESISFQAAAGQGSISGSFTEAELRSITAEPSQSVASSELPQRDRKRTYFDIPAPRAAEHDHLAEI